MTLGMRAAQIFIGLVAFTVVYFIILGTVAVFKSKYRRNAELSEKYQDQYKKQSKK
jgi:cytochrome bd-type quinol oxidase subunit 1